MPPSGEIVAGLAAIANRLLYVAVLWHTALAVGIVALLVGWRPSRRVAGTLLATPLASVALFAALAGNPFNAAMFTAAAIGLSAVAWRLPRLPTRRSRSWAASYVGLVLLTFGAVYPEFLVGVGPWTYLFAAPLGLIPCPTLAATIGIALLAGGLESRAWSASLAALGLFYGVFGVVRLGVRIDVLLALGALALAAFAAGIGRRPARRHRTIPAT